MIDIVPDRNMLVADCDLCGNNKTKLKREKKKWKLRDVTWEDFQVDLREIDRWRP